MDERNLQMKPKRQEREKGENRLWKFWKWSYGWKGEMDESRKVETKSWEPGKGAKKSNKNDYSFINCFLVQPGKQKKGAEKCRHLDLWKVKRILS